MKMLKLSYKKQHIVVGVALAVGLIMGVAGNVLIFKNPDSKHNVMQQQQKIDETPGKANAQTVQDIEKQMRLAKEAKLAEQKAQAEAEREDEAAGSEAEAVAETSSEETQATLTVNSAKTNFENSCDGTYRIYGVISLGEADSIDGETASGALGGTLTYTWEFDGASDSSNLPTGVYTVDVAEGRAAIMLSPISFANSSKNLSARLKILSPTEYTSDWASAYSRCQNFKLPQRY